MTEILIIDDDPDILSLLSRYTKALNHQPVVAKTLQEGLKLAKYLSFDLIFLDVHLPDGSGLDALPKFKQLPSEPEIIIITGVSDAEGAELAIKSGAWDYIPKPFSEQKIKLQVARVAAYRDKKSASSKVSLKRDRIIGASQEISTCLDQVAKCADTDTNVLITGETGTGKELFAKTIHENSQRKKEKFIVVDCAALPDNLIESILLGHVKGAFTGAEKDRTGLVAEADGGTLFLDEIGELPPSIQKSFLRILQERRFRPIGSNKEISSDFRLISATNKNLDHVVDDGSFRKDLLFRLRTFHIDLPPLRNRPYDIKELTKHHIFSICEKYRLAVKGFVPEFMDQLLAYTWPGNVRELLNALEKAVLSDPDNPILYPMHLPTDIRIHHTRTVTLPEVLGNAPPTPAGSPLPDTDLPEAPEAIPPLKSYRDKIIAEYEKKYLEHLLDATSHNAAAASRISKLSSSRLYTLLRQHGISVKDKKRSR